MLTSINPTTGNPIATYLPHDDAELRRRLDAAAHQFERWRATPIGDRAAALRRVAQRLRERRDELARLMTREIGKTIAASESEVDKCALACDFFAEHAPAWLADQAVKSDARESFVRLSPLGPVLAIMPWNFPFWQFFRFAAAALMAGNVAVLKHAPNATGCALAIESVFREADAPAATVLLVEDNAVAEKLIGAPEIRAVTLTGSDRAGRAVAAAAGRALKPCVMELGGSDAFIVLDDVSIEAVARAAADTRCINNGQSCIASKRFIVAESIADDFIEALASEMRAKVVGDPIERATQIGPMAREDLRDALDDQVRRSVAAGAKLICGGRRPDRAGFFYEPTVLASVAPGMTAFDEETFGPVAAVIIARDCDHAAELANASRFGLAASVWTRDLDSARAMIDRLEVGNVFVNATVRSDPRLPFGGTRDSGWGRELSRHGVEAFCNVKTVWVDEAR